MVIFILKQSGTSIKSFIKAAYRLKCNLLIDSVINVMALSVVITTLYGGLIVIVAGIPGLVSSNINIIWRGECHCNRYTKLVPGAICETVGGDCHCNRYTKLVPGAICETVQVLVSGGG